MQVGQCHTVVAAKRKKKAQPAKAQPAKKRGRPAAKRDVIVSTQAVVGLALGVPTRVVTEWRKDGMPGDNDGYDLVEIQRWLRECGRQPVYQRKTSQLVDDELTDEKKRQEIRRISADAEHREIVLQAEREKWIPREHLNAELEGVCTSIREALLLLPRQVRVHLGLSAEQERMIQEMTDSMLEDLSSDELPKRIEERRERIDSGVKFGGRGRRKGT